MARIHEEMLIYSEVNKASQNRERKYAVSYTVSSHEAGRSKPNYITRNCDPSHRGWGSGQEYTDYFFNLWLKQQALSDFYKRGII